MCIVDDIIKGLQEDLKQPCNEIFLSEADLQFCFAQKAKEKGAENIVLEYPIKTSELYKKNKKVKDAFEFCNKDINKDKTYIDVKFEYNNEVYFIELKYKTIEQICSRYSSEFCLTDQNADNIGRYLIYEDIERMENIIEAECEKVKYKDKKFKSYIIAITNDCNYWKSHTGINSYVSLKNGKTLSEMPSDNKCEKSKEFKHKHIAINKALNKDCGRPICLKYQYNIHWQIFKSFSNSEELCTKRGKKDRKTFGYLKIDLTKDKTQ